MKKKLMIGLILVVSMLAINVQAIYFFDKSNYRCTETQEYINWSKLSDKEKSMTIAPIRCVETRYASLKSKINSKLGTIGNTDPLTATKFDLRDYGYLSPVKNQEETGLCWTFATNEVVETNYALNNNNNKIDLSEKHIDHNTVEKFSDGTVNPLGYIGRKINDGGRIFDAISYLSSGRGPVFETDLPWSTALATKEKANLKNRFHVGSINVYSIGDCHSNGNFGLKSIKNELVSNGALFAVTHGYTDDFAADKVSYYYNGSDSPGHAITIVGWDDTYSASKFSPNAPGNGAWIIKDQYGTDGEFGDKGYYYVSYYDATICGAVFSVKNITGPNDNNYFHDGGDIDFIVADSEKLFTKSVFTKLNSETEILKKVNFLILPEMNYKIYYSSSGEMSDAKLLASGTGDGIGYKTISVNEKVEVSQNYSIIAEFIGLEGEGENEYIYPMDNIINSTMPDSKVGKGYYSNTGSQWLDSVASSNDIKFLPIIRAFTDNDSRKITVGTVTPSVPNIDNETGGKFNIPLTLDGISSVADLNLKVFNSNNKDVSTSFTINTTSNGFEIEVKKNITAPGTYQFIIATNDGLVSANGTFTVKGIAKVLVTEITVSGLNEVAVNGTLSLTATVLPANATNSALAWTSSNTSLATVENGVVKGLKEGQVTITAQSTDGTNVSSSLLVYVVDTTKIVADSGNTVKPPVDKPSSQIEPGTVKNPHTGVELQLIVIPVIGLITIGIYILIKKDKFKLS